MLAFDLFLEFSENRVSNREKIEVISYFSVNDLYQNIFGKKTVKCR